MIRDRRILRSLSRTNGGVKEQTAGLYAQHLADEGYITITADAAYQGGSGGSPRSVDKPAYRTEDIHGMADFITGVGCSQLLATTSTVRGIEYPSDQEH